MSGRCARNCDLDCHPRYQGEPSAFTFLRDHERAVRKRAILSQALRRAWARRKAKK